jgi:hypothetical protein
MEFEPGSSDPEVDAMSTAPRRQVKAPYLCGIRSHDPYSSGGGETTKPLWQGNNIS